MCLTLAVAHTILDPKSGMSAAFDDQRESELRPPASRAFLLGERLSTTDCLIREPFSTTA